MFCAIISFGLHSFVLKATYALYTGDVYGAYELYKQANAHQAAYELAVTYLAPDAVLREDLDLLEDLFSKLDESLIPDFSVGGQVSNIKHHEVYHLVTQTPQLFIDYVSIVSQVPELRRRHEMENAVPDAAEESQLEMLTSRIPRVIGILPDVLRDKGENGARSKAALSMMLSNLLSCLDASRAVSHNFVFGDKTEQTNADGVNTTLLYIQGQIESLTGLVDEAARLQHIHAAAYSSFIRTITVA
jgi:nuclear pore complex protein Nup98-Nup96